MKLIMFQSGTYKWAGFEDSFNLSIRNVFSVLQFHEILFSIYDSNDSVAFNLTNVTSPKPTISVFIVELFESFF